MANYGSDLVKKPYFVTLLVLLLAGSIIAKPAPDYYISKYDLMDLDFLRTRYFEINDARPIQIEGDFSSLKWIQPYLYKERMKAIGFDVDRYHVLQFSIREKDDFHYSFPILFFHGEVGDLKELEQLYPGERIVIYGRFYNLKKSEYAIDVDLIETVEKGGHERNLLVDSRLSPTMTPTPTITNTPLPSLWKRMNLIQRVGNVINPKESVTPTGTITPAPTKTVSPSVSKTK